MINSKFKDSDHSKSKLGYAIIDSNTGDFRPQIEILEELGCETIYQDIHSSYNSELQGLSELIEVIGSEKGLQIYCVNIFFLFNKVEALVPILELISEHDSELLFLEDNISISKSNVEEIIHIWQDLLEFKVNHRGRRVSKRNRANEIKSFNNGL